MKRVTRKRSKTKKRHTKRKYRGGDVYTPEKSVMPFQSVGYNGYPTASIAAYNNSVTSAEKQYAMNKLSGGASAGTGTSSDTVEVPSFAPIGGLNLAYSSTELSRDSNLTNLIGDTDALNDKLVYEDIPKVNNAMGGTKRRRRRQMKGIQMKGIKMKNKKQIKKRTIRR